MSIEYRKNMKKRAKKGDGLPHGITKAMIARAEKAAARNKARVDDGQTFRAHQHTDRGAPSSKRGGQYS
ncbi:hypothetical protein OZX74_07160 [Bifidobacterium sp. ESL0798]|uniref:hypothetical protein n=1 Tax=Bifidobacterium sp. ESL0798 TaxID=2983235 RepID=UPI0023F91468|nr:hypothetical protein [Bifidobacterium sp. ESL0798]WEV73677.1 hypothetical protein OZX74_07160 [Bifidobacterium sp. ESL0798]